MDVQLSSQAVKQLKRLNDPIKSRIIIALDKLSQEPPEGNIKALTGREGYRLRVGDYRILFSLADDVVKVHAIAPRGQAYKGGK